MESVITIKTILCTALGLVGAIAADLLGGWDAPLQVLLGFMGLDFAMGLVIAGVMRKSPNTTNGKLESLAGWRGLVKKGITLAIVGVGCALDYVTGLGFVRNCVIYAFMAVELISITENAQVMGVPIPDAIANAVETLVTKAKK